MTQENKNKVEEKSFLLQKDCQKVVEGIMSVSATVTYQDATNVWIFNKLAQLELEIEKLNKQMS